MATLFCIVRRLRGPSGRPLRGAGALAVVAVAVGLLATTALDSRAAPAAQEEPPRTGGQYWAGRYGCTACHGPQGQGTPIGPALVGRPDGPLSYEVFLQQVRTPLLLMPDFPPDVLSDEKVQAITEYYHQFEAAR